ncbi:MAG: DUF929 family protein [Actinomycetota bacterium]
MGKAKRSRQRSSPARRERPAWRRYAPTIVVSIAVVGMVVLGLTGGDAAPEAPPASTEALAAVTSVPASTLDAIGAPDSVDPSKIRPLPTGEPALERDGLPLVTYIGAEFCPYCAAERWPMVVALSRFGTFSGLTSTVSGPAPEPYPETATLTFHGVSYTSDYLALSAAEFATNVPDGAGGFTPLDTLTAEQQRILDTYDVAAYVGSDGGVPFVLIGNRYGWVGASYDVGLLTGRTFDEIALGLADPQDEVARAIGGTANVITAMLCQLTGGEPGDVCSSAGVVEASALLPA